MNPSARKGVIVIDPGMLLHSPPPQSLLFAGVVWLPGEGYKELSRTER